MEQPGVLVFVETIIFSIIALAWASWEYFSVSRLQKKHKEEAERAASGGEDQKS